MTTEKIAAAQSAVKAAMMGKGRAATLAPFVSRARTNAKRLRRQSEHFAKEGRRFGDYRARRPEPSLPFLYLVRGAPVIADGGK